EERFDPAQRIRELSRSTWRVERPSDAEEGLETPEPATGGESRPGNEARALGTAWHTLFEALAAKRKLPIKEIDTRAIVREVLEASGPVVAAVLETQAEGRLEAFMASPLWKELAAAERVLTEVPFSLAREDGDETVLRSGIVDLAFLGKGGWTIVDYKSDRASEATLRNRHASQIQAYVDAWGSLFSGQRPRGFIWSTHLDRALSIIEPPIP
ncbi:MAG: PD-(D/E)XK nuclease family protein, partial [Bacteroidetes bacterium]|nr:PD-(D/E)XK nuclease family protein [Bacteroidota bacterium]MDA0875457.1 PD-(D/E)XK nuclease family protein [Bacteroidota bacterium]